MRQRFTFFVSILFFLFYYTAHAATNSPQWPQADSDGHNQLFIYQPQVDSWKDRLTASGKVAVQVLLAGQKQPVVGMLWFTADTAVNPQMNLILFNHFEITKSYFFVKDKSLAKLAASTTKNLLNKKVVILSLDRFLSMALTKKELPKITLIKTQIPYLATIKRDQVSLTVNYSGKPQFKPILGTSLSYAINTATTVIKVGGRYFALTNGIWFVADKAIGPWTVAVTIPNEIDQIPANSSVANAAYVKIYGVNPQAKEIVYGYTAGYLGNKMGINPYAAWQQGVVTQWDEWSNALSKESIPEGIPLEGNLYVGKDNKIYRTVNNRIEKYDDGRWVTP